jgi:hypothetical protein
MLHQRLMPYLFVFLKKKYPIWKIIFWMFGFCEKGPLSILAIFIAALKKITHNQIQNRRANQTT